MGRGFRNQNIYLEIVVWMEKCTGWRKCPY